MLQYLYEKFHRSLSGSLLYSTNWSVGSYFDLFVLENYMNFKENVHELFQILIDKKQITIGMKQV